MNAPTARLYRQGDEKKIVELLENVFGGWPHIDINSTPLEYWCWKYLDNPGIKNSVAVVEDDQNIVACHHHIYAKVKLFNEEILGGMAVDFAVHPNHQGKGLSVLCSRKNMEARESVGGQLLYWITSNPKLIQMYAKSKDPRNRSPHFPKKIINLTRIKDIDKQLNEMPVENAAIKKYGYKILDLGSKAASLLEKTEEKSDITIEEITKFDSGIDQLWEDTKESYDFIVERKKDYLNWKYCDARVGGYVIKQAIDSDGRILGYMILRINKYKGGYPIGYIVDLLALPDRLDVAESLARTGLDYFDTNNVNIINFQIIKGHPYEKTLTKLGFHNSRINMHLFYGEYLGLNTMEKLTDSSPSRTFLTWGDHDVLPVQMPKVA